jgi:hypothetical protein
MEQTKSKQAQQEALGGVFLIADDDEFFRMALSQPMSGALRR